MQNLFLVRSLCRNIRPLFESDEEERAVMEYVHRLRGEIRVENLHFSYPGDSLGCLNGISFCVRPGEKVAHRLSTVAGFDRIIVVKDGIIVEEGGYRELMDRDGSFAALVRRQLVKER